MFHTPRLNTPYVISTNDHYFYTIIPNPPQPKVYNYILTLYITQNLTSKPEAAIGDIIGVAQIIFVLKKR